LLRSTTGVLHQFQPITELQEMQHPENAVFNLVFCKIQLPCDIPIGQSIAHQTIDGKKYAQSPPKSTHCAPAFSQKLRRAWLKRTFLAEETFRFSCLLWSDSLSASTIIDDVPLQKLVNNAQSVQMKMEHLDDQPGFWVNSGVNILESPVFPSLRYATQRSRANRQTYKAE
jgi:hypothetical protein